MRYSSMELKEIVCFGVRLQTVPTGLQAPHQDLICRWLMQFGSIEGYEDQGSIEQLLAPSEAVLKLLDMRPGMERWIAQLS